MGIWEDLLYFAPVLQPRRGSRLLLAKIQKRGEKRRIARALDGGEAEGRLLARLQLRADAAARHRELIELWTPLIDSPDLSSEGSVARAGAVREGVQHLFGRPITVGWPPRWAWRWDDTPQAEEFTDDIRSTWELQRLQGILPLAWAAHRTGGAERESWAGSYLDALLDFHRVHPGPAGPAWSSALEIGLRLVALVQGLPLVVETAAFVRRDLAVLETLDRHARWLRADLSLDKVVRGNHFLGELAGLLAVGHLLPGGRAAWWHDLKMPRILESEILRQFHPDGVSVEQSLTYEKFVLEFLVVAGRAGKVRGESFAGPVRDRLLEAAGHLEAVTAPDGTLPRIGDVDSGRGADWGESDPHRPGGLPARVREVFGYRDAPAAAPAPPGDAPAARRFPHGGHLVVRTPGDDFLFLRGGPFGWGLPRPAAHSHADWLSPVLYLNGEPLWIDPGVYGYRVGEELRDRFRGWDAHNTLYFEESPGPVPAGTFRWEEIGPPAVVDVKSTEEGVEIQGRVRWGRGAKALLWHRSIRYNQLHDTWLIRDRTSGEIPGPVMWALHFAPQIQVEADENPGTYRVLFPSGRTRWLRLDPAGEVVLDRTWIAPAYGERQESVVLRRRLAAAPDRSEIHVLPHPGVDPARGASS